MIYEYKCTGCEKEFEAVQRMEDDPLTLCPFCNWDTVKRIITGGNGFRIHGDGVYKPTSKIDK